MYLCRGIEFHILFSKKLTYYDIIPDLEFIHKRRFKYNEDYEEFNILQFITMQDTDKRLSQSKYFTSDNNWFNAHKHTYLWIDPPFEMTHNEQLEYRYVHRKYGEFIIKDGWVDMIFICDY